MTDPELMTRLGSAVVLAHAITTWAMVGVILVIQIVHYPLFEWVGTTTFVDYEALHAQRITRVVGPLMLIELATAIFLAVRPPHGLSSTLIWSGLALLILIWISTAFVQVPLHRALAAGFDPLLHRKLLATNWVRTSAWVARGIIAAILLYPLIIRPVPSP